MKLFLSWWWDANQTKVFDDYFKSHFSGSKKVLYIPRAMYPERYDSCKTWVSWIFNPEEGFDIELLHEDDAWAVDIHQIDAVYIGWGNTYRLLHLLRQTGFDKLLLHFVSSGKLVYGWSAWALILSENICSCDGDLNIFGYTTEQSQGLNLIDWFRLFCHYKSKNDAKFIDFTTYYDGKYIGLGEGMGLIKDDDGMRLYGEGESGMFEKGQKLEIVSFKL